MVPDTIFLKPPDLKVGGFFVLRIYNSGQKGFIGKKLGFVGITVVTGLDLSLQC